MNKCSFYRICFNQIVYPIYNFISINIDLFGANVLYLEMEISFPKTLIQIQIIIFVYGFVSNYLLIPISSSY